ncbi:chemotaxis protein CheB [Ruminococcus sp. Marseille-P6503]|uniref:chemotaxis protein CheB n=1 Tax=Ruminococcus sp. Marseille-P6503 TaxID=2364796 RepID=UPI000F51EED0|nr:chemotaxis protein CheB [Ruminococcus sp. Marseille-P6503]
MADKKVLIADDSQLFCRIAGEIVDSAEGFCSCASAGSAYDARDKIEKLKPDLIILDIEMPRMNGLHFLEQLIPQYAVPVIVCSGTSEYAAAAFEAGAADFIVKPVGGGSYESFKAQLKQSLKLALNLKCVKCNGKYFTLRTENAVPDRRIIAVAGSTGSTEVLPELLRGLGSSPPPVAVVLHMPEGYTGMYAKWLNGETSLTVTEASHGLYLETGMVVIAQGNRHMRVFRDEKGYFVSCDKGSRVSGHCPSADVLFESVAHCAGRNAVGVILTGMGSDGAKGLKLMKDAGAYNIGQSRDSCVVYGMPKAAFELGAVDKQAAPEDIAAEINLRLNA